MANPGCPTPDGVQSPKSRTRNSAIGILFIAFPFLISGILLLLENGPAIVSTSGTGIHYRPIPGTRESAAAAMVHTIGVIGLAIAVVLVGFYFHVQREIDTSGGPKRRNSETSGKAGRLKM